MSELRREKSFLLKQYLERVDALLQDATRWCHRHKLEVETRLQLLSEEREGKYEAPALYISKDGNLLAKIVPAASDALAADGLVEIVGSYTFHNLVFYGEYDPGFKSATIVIRRPGNPLRGRLVRRIEENGWYWIESRVRRAVLLDEALFMDLLADVCGHDIH
ncbi:hypothetical protein [Pandoraea commovens]|uniref:Uncharacterized protein n=1 Tax=Pandoraea commovens TaxID=2508289 RepID=A0A5E4WN69_9BURK|nr:hypothetical protein [Pandoraea commovens]UVA80633.1 hypothetical protein NTU39_06385 [Pandoraea commovens]VVE25981.1 hypothetical protein PCO31010_03420 [Pandoraea commovens]